MPNNPNKPYHPMKFKNAYNNYKTFSNSLHHKVANNRNNPVHHPNKNNPNNPANQNPHNKPRYLEAQYHPKQTQPNNPIPSQKKKLNKFTKTCINTSKGSCKPLKKAAIFR